MKITYFGKKIQRRFDVYKTSRGFLWKQKKSYYWCYDIDLSTGKRGFLLFSVFQNSQHLIRERNGTGF